MLISQCFLCCFDYEIWLHFVHSGDIILCTCIFMFNCTYLMHIVTILSIKVVSLINNAQLSNKTEKLECLRKVHTSDVHLYLLNFGVEML